MNLEIAAFSYNCAYKALRVVPFARLPFPSRIPLPHKPKCRIELCAGPPHLGGLTPTTLDLRIIACQAWEKGTEIRVMIRPRGGGFVYSTDEFEQMKHSIDDFIVEDANPKVDSRDMVSGFVFGILKPGDNGLVVDEERCRELVLQAGKHGKKCTFHKAFDEVADLDEAAAAIRRCGFDAILTSGGKKTAMEGVEIVKGLSERFTDMEFLVAGGVRSGNLRELAKSLGGRLTWVHSAASVDGREVLDPGEVERLVEIVEGVEPGSDK